MATFSHGVRKGTSTSLHGANAGSVSERQSRESRLAAELVDLESAIAAGRREPSRELLDLTTRYLTKNPEHYTIWNVRRECLQALCRPFAPQRPDQDSTEAREGTAPCTAQQSEAEHDAPLIADLLFVKKILPVFPKAYPIWQHRKWLLARQLLPDHDGELLLVAKLLERDPRNFHVWQYRRWVVARMTAYRRAAASPPSAAPHASHDAASADADIARSDTVVGTSDADEIDEVEDIVRRKELAYALGAVQHDFSNFSAWYARSRLGVASTVAAVAAELDLLRDAVYTDPDDQSVWLYHHSLCASPHATSAVLQRELEMAAELLQDDDEHVWCNIAHISLTYLHHARANTKPTQEEKGELDRRLEALQSTDSLRKGRYKQWRPWEVAA